MSDDEEYGFSPMERDAAIAERDRLRRELEALRMRAWAVLDSSELVADALRDIAGDAHSAYLEELRYVSGRLGAILRGES